MLNKDTGFLVARYQLANVLVIAVHINGILAVSYPQLRITYAFVSLSGTDEKTEWLTHLPRFGAELGFGLTVPQSLCSTEDFLR